LSRIEPQNNGNVQNLKEILQNLVVGFEIISKYYDTGNYHNSLLAYNYFSRAYMIIKICEKCIDEIPWGKNISAHGADAQTAAIINKLSYQLIK
jgi:hypothetical protein